MPYFICSTVENQMKNVFNKEAEKFYKKLMNFMYY